MVGSLDVGALYLSIDQVQGPNNKAGEISKSELKFDNVDEYILSFYLAVTFCKKRSIVEGIWMFYL